MDRLQDTDAGAGGRLLLIYRHLFECYGPQHWWPADEPFEVMVGAVLTQSAAWSNVEKAIAQLRDAGVLSPWGIRDLPRDQLALLVYSSGYFNAKAAKLLALAQYLGDGYDDSLPRMFARETYELREELLAVHGVGQETADSILLYAAGKPILVVDAYTKRIFSRVGLCSDRDSYGTVQKLFMDHLPPDAGLFNQYHALIVRHGKDICRKRPFCHRCCLLDLCQFGQRVIASD